MKNGLQVQFGPVSIKHHPDIALLASLRDQLDNELRSALRGARRVALVNFGNMACPGDSAIWLGTLSALRRLGVNIAYQCPFDAFSPSKLRRAVPDGPILINGGGNFGDIYPTGLQELRERLLRELRGTHAIQLTQNLQFKNSTNIERMRRLIGEHGDFTLMVRDLPSETLARDNFDADIRLTPDMAFGLGALPRLGSRDVDIMWMEFRKDHPEYANHGAPPQGVTSRIVDWEAYAKRSLKKWSARTARNAVS